MSIMKRRTLLALVAIAVVLFGLTLNSCKDCNSGKNRGEGKDPLGNGSSEGNLGSGSSTNNSGGKGKDPLGSGSSEGNLTDKNKPVPSGDGSLAGNSVPSPKKIRVLTQAEQEELDGLKGELVAAAKVIALRHDGRHNDDSLIKEVTFITREYASLVHKNTYDSSTDEEKWFHCLYFMCIFQENWATYLKEECDKGRTPKKDNNNKDKEKADKYKVDVEKLETEVMKVATGHKDIRDTLEPLLKQAKSNWNKLVTAENAYRGTLQRFGII
jgi:hypothetical protein